MKFVFILVKNAGTYYGLSGIDKQQFYEGLEMHQNI